MLTTPQQALLLLLLLLKKLVPWLSCYASQE
jgi:hypothetical protein